MAALLPATFTFDLKPAKTNGLADLGVPLTDSTEVKKGKLAEAMQLLDGDKIGRRFQNLRATLVKATEGGQPGAKLLLSFEVFGDDTAPMKAPSAVSVLLQTGDQVLAERTLGPLYLPYAVCWYENHFAVDVPLDVFTAVDRLSVLAAADEVRAL